MKIRMQGTLFVIGKPTQQGKKDQTVTYYYVTASQGEDEAGKIRVADVDTYDRIQKYKEQLFTFEFNDQYNSFVIADVAPMPTPDNGKTDAAPPDSGKTDTAPPEKPKK